MYAQNLFAVNRWLRMRAFRGLGIAAVLFLAGCLTPIGIHPTGKSYTYTQIDQSALNADAYSSYTAALLFRYDLVTLFEKDPYSALVQLHDIARTETSPQDIFFALAELSYYCGRQACSATTEKGEEVGPANFFYGAAVYAYLYVNRLHLQKSEEFSYDAHIKTACFFYNRSLDWLIGQRDPALIAGGTIRLPVNTLTVTPGHTDFEKPLLAYPVILPANSFEVRGLAIRNRLPGVGAPVVLATQAKTSSSFDMADGAQSATLFLRIQGDWDALNSGTLTSLSEVYSPIATRFITLRDNRLIPLEQDITAPIAYALNEQNYWDIGREMFLHGMGSYAPGIYLAEPYRAGRIPVLLIHGTMSSPVWWAQMWNTLMNDPLIREKYQLWFYLYDTGKPTHYSATELRDHITRMVARLDPEHRDPALQKMVAIGHSQGGLLARLLTIDSGTILSDLVCNGHSPADLGFTDQECKQLRAATHFYPQPEIKRVIFIATPHRGVLLLSSFLRRIGNWFIHIPEKVKADTLALLQYKPKINPKLAHSLTSLDSMSPNNIALQTIADLPIPPNLHAHSIIAINGAEQPPAGDDGVVQYTSAHLKGVESELVVRSGHSCQAHPRTIEEVRRILLEHLK